METIKKAIKHCGGRLALARAIKASPEQPYRWAYDIIFPSSRSALAIEKATNGAVTAKEILIEKQQIKLKRMMDKDSETLVKETLEKEKKKERL